MGRIFIPMVDDFPKTADVVVIGGGIVGVATAFWVSRAGLDTVLVEMRDGLSTLTTANSAESFRLQFLEKPLVELAKPSLEVFDHFADVVGIPGYDISIHHQGELFLTDEEWMLGVCESVVEQCHEWGVTDVEFLSGAEVRRRFPFVAPAVVGATFRQDDGWLSAHEVTQGFAKGSSATYLISTKAIGMQVDAQGVRAVETTRGTISTRIVVNAAGPFAGIVGKMVGLDLPLEPIRKQKVFIAPQPDIPQDAPFTADLCTEAYWRPEVGGALLGGGELDASPSEPAETLPTDWDFPTIVLEKAMRLTPFWGQIAQRLRRDDVRSSAGQQVYTPDLQPLIGPVSKVPGFYLNCGYWNGVMLSPEAGRRVAQLIAGEMKPEENPLRPTRYAEGLFHPSGSFHSGH